MKDEPPAAPHRSALPLQAGYASATERFREAIRSALGQDVRLVPVELPPGCSAVWFGDIGSDWIGYADSARQAACTVAHVAGHLGLLHCGRVRDGGRFACMDTAHGNRSSMYAIHMLFGGDSDLPGPVFTPDEEEAASSFAAELLAKCGYRAEAPALLPPGAHQAAQCLG